MNKSFFKIFVVIILIIFLLGGIIVGDYWYLRRSEEAKKTKEEREKTELSGEVSREMIEKNIREIINKALPLNFERENAEYFINDLDNDSWFEVIVTACLTAAQPQYYYEKAYLGILRILNPEGDYQELCALELGEAVGLFRDVPRVAKLDDLEGLEDIDGDGQKEIILYLGTGGASSEAYGIFDVDWKEQKINWLNIKDESGAVQPTFFLRGGGVMHQETFQLNDLDGGGGLEVIEKNGRFIGDVLTEEENWGKPENWEWQQKVYRWDGEFFSYDEELTAKLK